ncbi:MAG TPA: hypothetical protein VFP10_01685 [Candidatus Eisenbacteria bacterium]|nr:hypothetical protein [Candidatus Eisenbacteria bacterium]
MATTSNLYAALAAAVEMTHGFSMIVWGLGLPLLVWHRYERLSRAYMWYAIAFVVISVTSNRVLGECFLTTFARQLWLAGGGYRDGVPFTVLFANAVAGIRPTAREAVLAWQLAIVVTSIGTLWCWRKTGPVPSSKTEARARGALRRRYDYTAWRRNALGR